MWSYNPGLATTNPVWAAPRSLATTRGIICYFLFLRVLRCFSSPGLPLLSYKNRSLVFHQGGCPIRISVDRQVCALPHSFSQLIASFVASESLGILRVPLRTSSLLLLRKGARSPSASKAEGGLLCFLACSLTSKNGRPPSWGTRSTRGCPQLPCLTIYGPHFASNGSGKWRITDSNR